MGGWASNKEGIVMPKRSQVTQVGLAYAAGIIDGEGCIGIFVNARQHAHRNPLYYASVEVGNTDFGLVTWLKETFGGSVRAIRSTRSPNNKPAWVWRLHCRKAAIFLSQIAPFLLVKREQAALIFEFYEGMPSSWGSRRPLPPEELARREEMHRRSHMLNHRGMVYGPE
jgi:hypothetical protein